MKDKIKILVTDDSATTIDAIEAMLENDTKSDFLIIRAANGSEGCKIAYKEKPDIILMDIEMPVMDGIKATKKIKQTKSLKDIPIIVMSTSKSLKNAFLAGANDFIIKPFTEFELLLRLNINVKLLQRSKELSEQYRQLITQKIETERQNEVITKQQKDLLDDMKYASHIQQAINPDHATLKSLCKDFFAINKPKSIVGGDFYWVSASDERLYFAVGDCTGHGISGALMTMTGNTFLNEIIHNIPYSSPGNILNELRTKIIQLLNQKGAFGEASSGMDIALCVFEPRTRRLEYAGANNPIYIARNNSELEIIKADRMPIGIYVSYDTPFKSYETNLGLNDTLYMFTDGYPDQFGGPKGHKFRYRQFRELLLANASKSMKDQQMNIEATLSNWIKGYEQIDDILLLGLRL